jgi:DNA-binding transcriptional LysR family regulator
MAMPHKLPDKFLVAQEVEAASMPIWDDLRLFLQIARLGSFTKAAERLRVSQPTVGRRMELLEQQLGVRLFDRSKRGAVLTDTGAAILADVERMERSVIALERRLTPDRSTPAGDVRLSITDGLGAYWITPRLPSFLARYPDIHVDLVCSIRPADAARKECDISIMFCPPAEAELRHARIGTLHFVPFGSRRYFDARGIPANARDLLRHRILDHYSYLGDEGDWSAWQGLLGDVATLGSAAYKTNVSSAYYQMIKWGGGIGLLPTYAVTVDPDLVPLDIGVRTHSAIYVAFHPDLAQVARVRLMLDWLKEIFGPAHGPFFRDAFCFPSI